MIFIDGSYFCFYRYHSLLTWWKNAFPEDPIIGDPYENPIFVEKFKKRCKESILEISKKYSDSCIIVGKDCPRADIWRNEFYKDYKSTRKPCPYIGSFFKLLFDEQFFLLNGICKIIEHPHLEADDCIALAVTKIVDTNKNNIIIITSDKDYFQLENVQIWNLAHKQISLDKNPKQELFCKIVMGDSSDNITSVLKKCGPKTALKCYHDSAYFEKEVEKQNAFEKYKLNKLLVDFTQIPAILVEEFLSSTILV
jgi:5'-3' exonuclease